MRVVFFGLGFGIPLWAFVYLFVCQVGLVSAVSIWIYRAIAND